MTQTPSYQGDVVIVGGGLAGMTLALAMDQAGLTVALVDVLEMDEQIAPEFDGRASALAYTSWRMFEALGVAEYLRPHTQRIEHILVCDGRPYGGDKPGGPGPHSLHFDRREISDGDDGEPLGWMAENRHSRFALIQALKSKSGISVFAPARADRYETRGDGVELYLDDGRILSGQLLVACDGKFSRLRKQAAIRTAGWQYGQKGVVATVRHSEPHNGVAYEYFLPSGPFAILPLPDNRASLVWTEPDAIADALKDAPDAVFQEELENRFGDFLGDVRPEGARFTYPLGLRYSERFCDERIAFVGDAARGIHPLAGQGFNLGIRDAAALAEVTGEAKRVGLDIGALITLRRYEDWRKFDSVSLAAGTDLFNRLFSNDIEPVRQLRGLGMSLVNKIGPARRFFMRQAGGETGDPPRLLKGRRLDAA
ncbi:MAG: 2-octaprenyl-6-methoxyphenol hydroxylase [Maricaulis maris]|jgi:2-octaprenyl-6-methoxyphenol hydroxylase|uniref:Ubiquinone biosynthesis hydroxylase, UbiH/UbiF/VisC/COQ6 family n=1 Tax=Maricaulis maris (strain MCS10) TaxID=394221 RepID=Q0AKG9_MARMM|nr:UbiH/UbiF/VisC/COQ6 family ubiquinone biosynthesis hydroxylase [Maricaulis maris]ABI67224.1 Ubiquinone biosynthesis hydroxylase, UbiH/UbiF/VisC/COQ6 family [Maricaulis maris MCS10]